jgi:hypothetical protein
MFDEKSRYHALPVVDARTSGGRDVRIVKLRRLPEVAGEPFMVRQQDRLDLLAHEHHGDATGFWHIADANTDLYAPDLTEEPGRVIKVPER